MSASKKGSSDEASKVIQSLVSSLSKNPDALAEFKKNPAAAIGGLLDGNDDVSEETSKKVKKAVKEHGEGADLVSLIGSLGALFGDSHEEATAKHEAAGNPLNALAALLIGGNQSKASSAGNVLGMLGSVFGSSNGKGKDGIDAGDLVGMLGSVLGGSNDKGKGKGKGKDKDGIDAGDLVGMLGSALGGSNDKGKGKDKDGIDAGELVGMLGNLLGGK